MFPLHLQVAVNSGGKHCLALSMEGEVYSWGEGDDGKLGHGSKTSCDRPRVVEALRGRDIVGISCGGAHSAAITTTGSRNTRWKYQMELRRRQLVTSTPRARVISWVKGWTGQK